MLKSKLINGTTAPFLYMYKDYNVEITMFHDSIDAALSYIKYCISINDIKNKYFIFNFGWLINKYYANYIKTKFLDAQFLCGKIFDIYSNSLVLCNSINEFNILSDYLPNNNLAFVNNCFSISENEMFIEDHSVKYRAVYNARPVQFKNHSLTDGVEDLAFISYDEEVWKLVNKGDNSYVNIREFGAKSIYWNINSSMVRKINNQSSCGLMLSSEEGACYASLEYMLCGIPVISTHSSGGRDFYYNSQNSIIVNNNKNEIREAIYYLSNKMNNNYSYKNNIRENAISKQTIFRKNLSKKINEITGVDESKFLNHILNNIKQNSKLKNLINYWAYDVFI